MFEMVPHWLGLDEPGRPEDYGPDIPTLTRWLLQCGSDVAVPFYTDREDLGEMATFFDQASTLLGKWAIEQRGPGERVVDENAVQSRYASPLQLEALQKDLALFWLNEKDQSVDWERLLGYAEFLRYRTYENDPVSVSVIIERGPSQDGMDITKPGDIQKVLDPLATSPNVCLRVAPDLTLLGYGELTLDEASEPERGGYYRGPQFMRAMVSGSLEPGQFSFHRTRRGDTIIADRSGLVAAWRKGKWYVYTPALMRDTLYTLYRSPQAIADLLLDLLFDLSYKRHGALVIYDPAETVLKKVLGKTVLGHPDADEVRVALADSITGIDLASPEHAKRGKRRIAEVASMDGAVIIDSASVRAFGAMIPGDGLGAGSGARSRATYAARDLGGMAAKVSSDGDIVVPLRLGDPSSYHYLALRFA